MLHFTPATTKQFDIRPIRPNNYFQLHKTFYILSQFIHLLPKNLRTLKITKNFIKTKKFHQNPFKKTPCFLEQRLTAP